VADKRRLPVFQADRPDAGPDGDAGPRPPWHWVGFGAVAIFTAWLPLYAVAGALAARLAATPGADDGQHAGAGATIVAMHAVALAAGSFAGGFVVGRWGDQGVGVRHAALAGLAAALAAIGAAWVSSGFSPGSLIVVGVAVPLAAAGGWRGLRRRLRRPVDRAGPGARPPG
jgi:hypothetical protein